MDSDKVESVSDSQNGRQFVIRRKKVKFPTYQPRTGARWAKPTMDEERLWQNSRYPGRTPEVWIGGVKFQRVVGWSPTGQGVDVNWGWIYPLWNIAKALKSMGYRDYCDNSSMHGDFRYVDINEGVLNLIHVMFKDYKIPHILDSQEEESEENLALPLIQQVQAFNLSQIQIPNNSPVVNSGPPSP